MVNFVGRNSGISVIRIRNAERYNFIYTVCILWCFFSVTSVKCENCHEVLFSASKQDMPKEKMMEPAEVCSSCYLHSQAVWYEL